MTAAAKLKVGDVLGPGFLPASTLPATVVWVDPYRLNGWDWTFVVWQYPNGGRQGDGYQADHDIPTLTPAAATAESDGGYTPADRFLFPATAANGRVRGGTILQWVPPPRHLTGNPGSWYVELDPLVDDQGREYAPAFKTWLPPDLMLPADATDEQIAAHVERRRAEQFPTK